MIKKLKTLSLTSWIAILSMIISLYSCHSLQKQQETNAKPYLKFIADRYAFPNADGKLYFGALVKNIGLGPALITSVSISTHKQEYELSNLSPQQEYMTLRNIFRDNGFNFDEGCRFFPQGMISVNQGIIAGESIPLIIYPEWDNQDILMTYKRMLLKLKPEEELNFEDNVYHALYMKREICQRQVLAILANGITLNVEYKSIYGKINDKNDRIKILKVKYDENY